jgi:hypothetical protein
VDRLLKSGGQLSLAVPDLRYTFDFFQNPSTLGQLMLAERLQLDRHVPEQILDVTARNAEKNGAGAWITSDTNPAGIRPSLEKGWETYLRYLKSENYRDCHAWFFTPASFELILLELRHLGITSLVVDNIASSEEGVMGSEFFVEMTKGHPVSEQEAAVSSEAVHARRQFLLQKIIVELASRVQPLAGVRGEDALWERDPGGFCVCAVGRAHHFAARGHRRT